MHVHVYGTYLTRARGYVNGFHLAESEDAYFKIIMGSKYSRSTNRTGADTNGVANGREQSGFIGTKDTDTKGADITGTDGTKGADRPTKGTVEETDPKRENTIANSADIRGGGSEPEGADAHDDSHPKFLEVKKKLKRRFPGDTDAVITEQAKILQDPLMIQSKYFKRILTVIERCKADATSDVKDYAKARRFRNEAEKATAIDRVTYDMQRVQDIQVKLLWYELEQNPIVQEMASVFCPMLRGKEFVYGPFHVALQVDDVIIEWDDSSLIIPHSNPSQLPLLLTHIGELPPPTPVTDLESFKYNTKELLCTAENKTHLIEQLCAMIASYNTKQYYSLFTNNCQHFAVDVLEALGLERDAVLFRGKSDALAKSVMDGSGKIKLEFNNHEELNSYVATQGEGLSLEDLEFCRLHYLLFHAWSKKCPKRDDWRCKEEECRLGLVEDRLRCTFGGIP